MRYREWVNLYRTDIKNMHRIYIKKFLTLDTTQTEKIGTGKRISIIENSFHTRTDLIIH
ncbi:hypothetical protein KA405_05820 [Patescibacteria group bacterium]|nr:hypothetical protein [Patescibacteria group bacterium]